MNSQELVEITYRKSLNLLTIQGWFFRNTDLEVKCIEIIEAHFITEQKLTIIFKVELIDALSFDTFSKLIAHLNTLSTSKDIRINWIASGESMTAGQRLKHLAVFSFNTFPE